MESVPLDVWKYMLYELPCKDLMQLRQTCKHMNKIVKNMNEYWFKAYQFFLMTHLQAGKAKSAVKAHKGPLRYYCISHKHDKVQKRMIEMWPETNIQMIGYHQRLKVIEILMKENSFTENDCNYKQHFSFTIPKSPTEIPLNIGYVKKRKYIYHYLIECYRLYKKQHNNNLKYLKERCITLREELDSCAQRLERGRKELLQLEGKIENASKKYKDNHIYDGKRIDLYKGI